LKNQGGGGEKADQKEGDAGGDKVWSKVQMWFGGVGWVQTTKAEIRHGWVDSESEKEGLQKDLGGTLVKKRRTPEWEQQLEKRG